jgi:hypothetical protein
MGELGDHRTLSVLLEGLRDENHLIVDQTEKVSWICTIADSTVSWFH